ncbi:glycosyltransferase, MSMEG_0565 family [Pseudonocardia thermophila]|jgi:glycosyltransferase, MSMEG_0565 family|uniref:Glycosyltransferase, MSMEG_0565 family n=1 Tax=Pseudonocardia thermophila TaxID=1848 RepID=A0A1M6YHP2_PSETH|nr:MSMEG_0565 family glycosyltransferase [Pseudonocardia thermophila]SHL17529.1 glycosyltransferase, MSMEG_0565 family [Pseudonocardia thermophila]
MRIALITHSVKPRGGFVHTLGLAEALHRAGTDVRLVALGDGLPRATSVPVTLFAPPSRAGTALEERVFTAIDTLQVGLAGLAGEFDVLHAQDCIAARAAARVRDAGAAVRVIRTVHHVDDFTTRALIDCQRAAIAEPDTVLVVSEQWREILRTEYGRAAHVVPNGVDVVRFGTADPGLVAQLRDRLPQDRFVFLGMGGVEPRKGTRHAFEAFSLLKRRRGPVATFAIIGGHSFQDYTAYREAALAALPDLGLVLGEDVVLLGTVPDPELAGWYHAADALCFPSVKEGWGLAVMEAIAAGLPVLASDIPVFQEYLTDGETALLPAAGDAEAIAKDLERLLDDPQLRARLAAAARGVLPRYSWEASATRHREIYCTG